MPDAKCKAVRPVEEARFNRVHTIPEKSVRSDANERHVRKRLAEATEDLRLQTRARLKAELVANAAEAAMAKLEARAAGAEAKAAETVAELKASRAAQQSLAAAGKAGVERLTGELAATADAAAAREGASATATVEVNAERARADAAEERAAAAAAEAEASAATAAAELAEARQAAAGAEAKAAEAESARQSAVEAAEATATALGSARKAAAAAAATAEARASALEARAADTAMELDRVRGECASLEVMVAAAAQKAVSEASSSCVVAGKQAAETREKTMMGEEANGVRILRSASEQAEVLPVRLDYFRAMLTTFIVRVCSRSASDVKVAVEMAPAMVHVLGLGADDAARVEGALEGLGTQATSWWGFGALEVAADASLSPWTPSLP